MTEDAKAADSPVKNEASAEQLAPEELRIANLRQHLGYIIANVIGAFLIVVTIGALFFGETLEQTYNIPPYVPSMALLLEIGMLLVLAYAQQTYSKRFRLGMLLSGILTILEAGMLFYYANPHL